jgi:hypothetical protein
VAVFTARLASAAQAVCCWCHAPSTQWSWGGASLRSCPASAACTPHTCASVRRRNVFHARPAQRGACTAVQLVCASRVRAPHDGCAHTAHADCGVPRLQCAASLTHACMLAALCVCVCVPLALSTLGRAPHACCLCKPCAAAAHHVVYRRAPGPPAGTVLALLTRRPCFTHS